MLYGLLEAQIYQQKHINDWIAQGPLFIAHFPTFDIFIREVARIVNSTEYFGLKLVQPLNKDSNKLML